MFGFFKNELLEVIDWVEGGDDTLIWKFPDKESDIKYGAQLTVRDSQAAIFVNEGQIADVFYSGKHELKTENMPVLTKLKSWKYGFNSPFKADIYFVSLKQITSLRWGTANPFFVNDADMGSVETRANGSYFMKIGDPKKFFTEYSGTREILRVSDLEDTFRDLVVPKFVEVMAESGLSARNVAAQYSELGEQIRPRIQEDLTEFGLELTKFQIAGISMPPEITEHLRNLARMNSTSQENLSKMERFNQMDVMKTAAEEGNYENMQMSQQQMMMQQMMMQQMMQNNNNNNNQQAPQQQAPAAEEKMSREEVMKTLKELGELKQMGILTDEEFDVKKKELLAKL